MTEELRAAPQMQFSTANHPDQWWADGDVINFVTAQDAKKAESIFNALSNEVNRLRALRSERAPTQSLLDKLTPLTFELGSPRAALYSDDTVMIPWGYVKEALKNAAPQEAGMFDHLNVGASVSAATPNRAAELVAQGAEFMGRVHCLNPPAPSTSFDRWARDHWREIADLLLGERERI